MTYDSGVARAAYILDITQPRQAAAELRQLLLGIQTQSGSGAALRAPSGGADIAAQYVRQQQAAARLEATQANLARARKEDTGATALLSQAQERLMALLMRENLTFEQTIAIQRQLASVQTQAARSSQGGASFAQQFGQGVKSSVLGVVGPLALATAGFASLKGAVDFTEESFKLKAGLDTTNASIKLQLQSFRDVNQAMQQGRDFAERYKITQAENTEAIQASIPILRTSKASLTDVEGVLARMSVLKPEQGIAGAAFALGELQGGQARSLATRFNVPLAKANELRDAIRAGGDATKVLGDYLDSVGIGMNTLAIRTQGATGKMNELKVETEKFQLALGGQAGGPGLQLLETRIDLTRGATRLLSGDFDQFGRSVTANIAAGQTGILSFLNILQPLAQQTDQAAQAADAAMAQLTARQLAAVAAGERKAVVDDVVVTGIKRVTLATAESDEAVAKLTTDINDNADKSALDAANKDLQAAATSKVAFETKQAADAFLKLNPNLDASEGFAKAAAEGLGPLVQQVIALRLEADKTRAALLGEKLNAQTANQLIGAQSEAAQLRSSNRDQLLGVRSAAIQKAQADARAADQARINQLIRTGSAAQVVTQRQREYNDAVKQFGASSAQAIDAQTALIEAQQAAQKAGGRKRVDAAQSTALQLQNVEESSQLQLLRTQREGLERLRDQAEDYAVRRARSQEDDDRKIRGLLARGQRAEAAREQEEFALQQRRSQEDFSRERRRTLRNNAEGVGDIGARTDLRQSQIGERAALRGVRTPGGALPESTAPLPPGATAAAVVSRAPQQPIAQLTIQGVFNIDGVAAGHAVFPTVEILMDESLAISLQAIGVPGAGQLGVGGAG